MKNSKPTIYEFAKKIYGLNYDQYETLTEFQKQAIEIDYKNRYGSIKWF